MANKSVSNYRLIASLVKQVQEEQKAVGETITKNNKAIKDGSKTLQQNLAIMLKMGDAGKKMLKDSGFIVNAQKEATLSMREQTAHVSELQNGYSKMSSVMQEQAKQADALTMFAKERAPYEDEIQEAQQNQKDLSSDIESIQQKLSGMRSKDGKFLKGYNKDLEKSLRILIAEKKESKELADDQANFYGKAQATQKVLDKQKSIMEGMGKIFGKTGSQLQEMGKNAQAMMNPMTAGFAIIGFLVGGIVKAFKALNGATGDFQAQTKLVGSQSMVMKEAFAEMSGDVLMMGGSTADIAKSGAAIYEAFGSTLMVTKENVKQVTEMAVRLGVGHSEAAGFLKTMAMMGVTSSSQTKELSKQAEMLALQSGVAPGQVMEDIAKASGESAGYFRGNTQNLIKSAVYARKMGIEMTTMTNQADKLLDFESSVAAEMEASVLLGRQLNFDKARQLALEGDLEGASQAVLDQVGGQAEFNKLNIIQKKALAAAAGLELSQLQEMMVAQERNANLTDDQVKKLEEQTKQAQSVKTEFDKMKGILEAAMMEAFMPIALSIQSWIEGMGGAKEAGEKIKNMLVGIINNIKLAGMAFLLYFSVGAIGKVAKAIKGIGGSMGDIKKNIPSKGKGGGIGGSIMGKGGAKGAIAGAAALLIISAALYVTAKALQQFASVKWKSIGMASVMLGVLVGAVALIGAIMMSGVGAVAILAGAAALLILSVSLMAIGKAFSIAGPGMEAFGKMTKTMLEGVATIINSVGTAIVNIIHQIGTEVKRLSDIPGTQLLSVAAGITAVGVSLAAYGGGSVLAGIGSFIGNLLGGDPVKRFERFAASSSGLKEAAKGIAAIGKHLQNYDFNVGNINKAARGFKNLANAITKANKAARGGGILGAIKGFVGVGGVDVNKYGDGGIITKPEMAVVGEKGPEAIIPLDQLSQHTSTVEMGPVVQAINELKDQMAAIQVNIDGKKAGEMILSASPGGVG